MVFTASSRRAIGRDAARGALSEVRRQGRSAWGSLKGKFLRKTGLSKLIALKNRVRKKFRRKNKLPGGVFRRVLDKNFFTGGRRRRRPRRLL